MEKKDMSNTCDFRHGEYWYKANCERTMTQEDWLKWYENHCQNCKYMCEICMYGEE